MPPSPSNPSGPLHPTYYGRETYAQAEDIDVIKTALWNTVWNFDGPNQRQARYINTKYSVWIEPLYFEWVKFIPTLDRKNFQDILNGVLHHDNQRCASANGETITSFSHSHTNKGGTQRTPSPIFLQPRKRGQPSIAASFAIAHQRYLTIIITLLWSQTLLVMKPTLSGIHPALLQVNPTITTT